MPPIRPLASAPVLALGLALVALTPAAALAEGPIRLDLNRLDPAEGACRLVLVAENPGPDSLDNLTLEAALFDRGGQVAMLTLLDMQDLPAGRMRVRSFDLAGLDCADLGRVLVNDTRCDPQGVAACGMDLALSAQVDVEMRQ